MSGLTQGDRQGSENPSGAGCLVLACALGLVAGLGWSGIAVLVWWILQGR